MVHDLVGMSQGARIAEMSKKNVVPKIVTNATTKGADEKVRSPNRASLGENGPHQCDQKNYRMAADCDKTEIGASMIGAHK